MMAAVGVWALLTLMGTAAFGVPFLVANDRRKG